MPASALRVEHAAFAPPPPLRLVRPTLLLADDDGALRLVLNATLETGEFDLVNAEDGDESLRLARERLPQVAVLDVNMPGLDGFEVCRQIKGDTVTASTCVFLLTGRTNRDDPVRAREVGADALFTKPFSPLKLLDAIYSRL